MLAPIAWGTTYVTVTQLLPDDRPLLVATMRVIPAGIVLLIVGAFVSRWRPRGREWWTTTTAGRVQLRPLLPVAQRRRVPAARRCRRRRRRTAAAPGRAAVACCSPAAGHARAKLVIGCIAAFGVALVAIHPGAGLDSVGLLAAVGANVSFAIGVVLTKRYPTPTESDRCNRLAAGDRWSDPRCR